MAWRRVKKKLLRRVDREVRDCQKKGVCRPTVAVVLEHLESRQFLIVLGKIGAEGGADNPGIVKGGVGKGESVLTAALREIAEETGIKKPEVSFVGYCGAYDVTSVKVKEGCKKKRYFVFCAGYTGPLEIAINQEELSGHCWVVREDIEKELACLKELRQEKHDVLMQIFAGLGKK